MTHYDTLFSFGTLMDAELLELVCGHSLDTLVREPAVVKDHTPLWVIGDDYPVLVARTGLRTQGLIIRGLSPQALDRIIFFEGGEFNVQHLDVVNTHDVIERVPYFASTDVMNVSENIWQLDQWQRTTKADTMSRVVRYMQCYGKMSIDEADAYW